MSEIVRSWDLLNVHLVIGSFSILGWGPDDAIAIAPTSDKVEHEAGADGEVVVSRTNDRRHEVTISVMQTSAGFRDLARLSKDQDAEEVIQPLPFFLSDRNTGTKIRSRYAVFLNHPEIPFGKSSAPVEFRLVLGSPEIAYGESIV